MSATTRRESDFGLDGPASWLVGGAVSGLAGSVLFGVFLWMVDPEVVTEAIPEIYGVDPGAIGWAFHVSHGLVLGVIFGFLVTREPVLGTLGADVATDFIAAMGLHVRFALAGFVYGLAIWALLPVIAQTLWVAVGASGDPPFPAFAFVTLLGHLLYGLLLGAIFSMVVAVGPMADDARDPFAE